MKKTAQEKTTVYWKECLSYPVSDWQAEVAAGETRQGYWEWVKAQYDTAAAIHRAESAKIVKQIESIKRAQQEFIEANK
jgi:hypothetical protein